MEIAVPLVVGGLAGLSVATACGAEPRVPRVPPAELAHQTLEAVAEKLPRDLVESDLLARLARSWTSLIPTSRLGLVIEDDAARLSFLLLSSCVCCITLAVVSLSPIGFFLGIMVPFVIAAVRNALDCRRERHDAEEAMPEAFTALSMSLASGHSLAQGMRFVGAHAQEPVHTEFCALPRPLNVASRQPMPWMICWLAWMLPGSRSSPWHSRSRSAPVPRSPVCCPRRRAWWGSALSLNAVWTLRRRRRACRRIWSLRCQRECARCWPCFLPIFAEVSRRPRGPAPWCWAWPSMSSRWWLSAAL